MSQWSISLPTYTPEVLDNSQAETHARCPRLYMYRYLMRRGPSGKSFPIQFGLSYHKYREVVEHIMLDNSVSMDDEIHLEGISAALTDFEDPPVEHRHAFLNTGRLVQSLNLAKARIIEEQRRGRIKVVRAEDSFDVALPVPEFCPACNHLVFDPDDSECEACGYVFPRFGGRMDQVISWNGKLWVRDFKTTSRLGNTYADQFDPNHQISGYVWAAEKLSGRPVKGAIIETLYNTKNQGPEFKQFTTTRSPGQLEAWLGSIMQEITDLKRNVARVGDLGYLSFPQRTSACSDYGGCFFRGSPMSVGPCSMQNAQEMERWLEANTDYSHWDFTDPDKETSKA